VVDAHLDAIYGAGMLDNASATILNVAEQMQKVHPTNKLRFIWFGGEDRPARLDSTSQPQCHRAESHQLRPRRDVTATPNYLIGVLDPAGVDLFSRTVSTTFAQRVRAVEDRARLRVDYLTRSTRTTCSCHPWGPTRSGSTWSASRPAAC
jgi:hypothetical protein